MLKERELQLKEEKERRRREEKEDENIRREEREIADQIWRDERRLRQQEIDRQQKLDAVKTKDEKSLVGRTRKFAEAIKHVFSDMPTESAENLFKLYEIPADLQSKLLLPRLSGKAKAIVNKLSLTDLDSYEQIKKHLLCEFRLTPRELRSRFTQASKRGEETYALFAARLENLLLYYLRSRDADKDVKKMFDLMIADKLKDSLPAGALQYVLSLEGDSCFSPSKVASNADIYVSNYNEKGVYRGTSISNIQLGTANNDTPRNFGKPNWVQNRQPNVQIAAVSPATPEVAPESNKKIERGRRACWTCGDFSHVAATCPNKSKNPPGKQVKANACSVFPGCNIATVTESGQGVRMNGDPGKLTRMGPVTENSVVIETAVSPSVTSSSVNGPSVGSNQSVVGVNIDAIDCIDRVVTANSVASVPDIELTPLEYVDVFVNGRQLRALKDSRCECPLINSKAVMNDSMSTIGSVWIQPIVGPAVPDWPPWM